MAPDSGSGPHRALMVIDVQNLFCHPEGSVTQLVGPLYRIDETLRGIREAIREARCAGRPILYTRHCYDAQYVNAGRNFPGPNPIGVTGRELMKHGAFVADAWNSRVLDEVAPADGDVVLDKTRYDAFLGTPLESVLHNLGVAEVDFCGVVTNICVETTVRAAFMRDFACTVFADRTTAGTREMHETALWALDTGKFATITDSSAESGGDRRTQRPPPHTRQIPGSPAVS